LQPEGLPELLTQLKAKFGGATPLYLSVVNDMERPEGGYDNKTLEPIRAIFADENAMDAHIDELLALCAETGVDGLEIDYEALRTDTELWGQYAAFIGRLYARAQEAGLRLRSVLGYDSAQYAAFPEGPDYVIMCYNLYGYHSGPGPKADFAFLAKTFGICSALPGTVRMAFATGGFDWVGDKVSAALTQLQAEALAQQQGAASARDEASGAVRFLYTDANDLEHEVWYADGSTLSGWYAAAVEAGYAHTDLFRLGGNNMGNLLDFLNGDL
ncbi:MAG: hypothetical protein PHY12_13210, partial [Eubacteriales bacterium]|nr:hypothetical protein [Eubacteriales bacterium]